MGQSYIWGGSDWIPSSEYVRREPKRSGLPTPMLSRDGMEPVQSMLDGKFYDSKSALRATYRAAGVEEVGNDSSRLKTKAPFKPDRAGIRQSILKAKEKLTL